MAPGKIVITNYYVALDNLTGIWYCSGMEINVEELAAELANAWCEGHRTGWTHHQDGDYGTDWWDDDTHVPDFTSIIEGLITS